MMVLHIFRVYLIGGFKKPHELITWVRGVVLNVLTTSFDVSGYSLSWDQISYLAVKSATGIITDLVPVASKPACRYSYSRLSLYTSPSPLLTEFQLPIDQRNHKPSLINYES
ncbi:hypothetical protein OSB04_015533 [Centaurea solstitialis]|uniref:Cytochrome b/b6 N-terminal region profile domain-containing protein n=1 Tax=Centaurea solstitialis TaxID=347529 RepID=A0AA38SZE7_9ASTR|nr:hypothetical protein OSB04_015533 [Centaurea solstitialis]